MPQLPSRRSSLRRLRTLAVTAVAAGSLATTALVAAPASATAPSVRIGLEGPITGSQSSIGLGMLNAAKMAAADLNAHGGILGRHVVIVPIDDQANPAIGVAAAKAALASGLDGIVGPYNSGVGAKTLPLYRAAGLVPIRLTSANSTQGFGVTLQPMTSQIAPVATTAITNWEHATRVGIIYDGTPGYTASANTAMVTDLTNAGVTITADTAITPGQASYDAAVTAVDGTTPDLIYVIAYYPEAGKVAASMANLASPAKCFADFGAYDNAFVQTAGVDAAMKCPVLGVPAPSDFNGASAHLAEYRAMFHSAPGTWGPYAYDSVNLLAAAATSTGGFGHHALLSYFHTERHWSGWTGPARFDVATGNRIPSPVVVTSTNLNGALHTDPSWQESTGVKRGNFTFDTLLTSSGTTLHTVDGVKVYGWNDLVGTITAGPPISVQMQGNVNYVNGSEAFTGFLTFTFADGATIGLSMIGSGTRHANGSTTFVAPLTVIGGTGLYANARGTGTFTGSRTGALGSPVTMDVALHLN